MDQSSLVTAALKNDESPVPFFRCPSDGGTGLMDMGSGRRATTNYVCNSGTWWHKDRGFDGPFQYWDDGGPPFGSSAMTRGLSNTSALTEIIHADGGWHRMRVHWESAYVFTSYSQIDDFSRYCQELPDDPQSAGMVGNPYVKGGMWKNGSVSITLYNHVTPPNQPSCLNGGTAISAAMSASSFHTDIVHVAYLDGHVAPIANQIDIRTWRELASR
jgi:prepilin-type processing-associated H-X9-DG protein